MIIIIAKDLKEERRITSRLSKSFKFQKKGRMFFIDSSLESDIYELLMMWFKKYNTEVLETVPFFSEPPF